MKIIFLFIALVTASCSFKENVDLLLVNGKIVTMNEKNPQTEAVAIRDGKILELGRSEDLRRKYVANKIEDLHGALALPGLIDAHLHMFNLGHALLELNVTGTSSYEEILEKIADRIKKAPKASWIRGRGWDQNDWVKKEFPTKQALDVISPDHFIYMTRVDGHAVLVNQKALDLAKITRQTQDPPGGQILRDVSGNPTGVLVDNAINLLIPFIPPYTMREDSLSLELAMTACLEVGLTSVHDAGIDTNEIYAYKELGKHGRLRVRSYAMLDGTKRKLLEEYYRRGPEKDMFNKFLTIASIKLYSDGALGSRGAALLEPYSDSPESKGLELTRPQRLEIISTDALKWGFQVSIHAIGDRGNRNALNAYESALTATRSVGSEKRLRIEHVQVVSLEDIPRFVKLGVIASFQPTHCTSDMYWAETRVGPERIKGAYAWQSFLNAGIVVAGGSDAPVESNNPLLGIYAAVTRQDHKGWPEGGWYPEQRMTIQQAIHSFTMGAAYAEFAEKEKGSIEPGKLADIVVLSKDIMTIDPKEILTTEVLRTIVNGKILYSR